MTGSEYTFDGLDDFEQTLSRMIEKEYPQEFRSLVVQVAHELQGRVKENSPKKTGNLRRNWKVGAIRKEGDTYYIDVYNNTEYAEPVEYGHRGRNGKGFIPGSHMLAISLEEVNARLPDFLRDWLSDFLNCHEL